MSFDKAKIMRTAEKNLAQGKIQAAIKDYCQIVENDPKDFNAMNLLGDLYVRSNSEAEAVKWFTRIAEQYSSQGFAHKAIAMYKKIARLKPQSVEISAKLAPLYQQQGLMAEARSHYLTVADSYKNNGMRLESLEILGKIADLDPNNTDIRLKLAEGYLQENHLDKAADAFVEAASRLIAKGQHEDSLAIFNKVLDLRPVDTAALNGATSAHIALGFPDEAVSLLENAFAVQADSTEIMSLLIHAYLEAEHPEKAETVAHKLVTREPASHKRFLEIAKAHLKKNDAEGATRCIAACSEQLLGRGQDKDLEFWINEVLKHNPENPDTLRLLVRLHNWQHDDEKLRGALERLYESAQLNGNKTEEHAALAQLVPLKSDDENLPARLRQLEEELGIESTKSHLQWAETAVPSFESFEQMTNEDGAIPVSSEAIESFHQNALSVENGVASVEWANTDFTVTYNTESESNGAPQNGNSSTISEENHSRQTHLRQELESVDFYITQGYQELASETLVMLEKQFGQNAEIEARKKQLEPSKTFSFVAETTFDFSSPMPFGDVANTGISFEPTVTENETHALNNTKSAEPRQQFATNQGIDPGLAELFDEYRDSVENEDAEASQGLDYETHYNLGLAYKEMGLMEDAIEEFQQAIKRLKEGDRTPRYLQCCNLLGHCFMEQNLSKPAIMWFKKGLDAPHQSEDEYQALRYELALAYEAGGEMIKALDLFGEIYATDVSYRNVGERMRELQALKV